jgi:TonB-dependent SusC/RagA subfamily outer membrane receptor
MIILNFLLKGTCTLTVLGGIYYLLLQKETFFKWNRLYFLVGTLVTVLLPLIDFSMFFNQPVIAQNDLVQNVPNLSLLLWFLLQKQKTETSFWENLSFQDVITGVFMLGVLVMALRFIVQLISLIKLRNEAQKIKFSESYLSDNQKDAIYFLHKPINPFSFFNWIFINPALHSDQEFQDILSHERVHVRQWHSLDVILSEILLIVFWFNPMAWFWRKHLKQNLEFLADQCVISEGVNKKYYQYNLLKISGIPNDFELANHFNFQQLKKRISMMNKQKSSKVNSLKLLLTLPILGVLLTAFNKSENLKISNESLGKIVEKVMIQPIEVPNVKEYGNSLVSKLTEKKVLTTPENEPVIANLDSTKKEKTVSVTLNNGLKSLVTDGLSGTIKLTGLRDVNNINPIYIIDGVETPPSSSVNVSPDDIVSMNVMKGNSAVALYGEKARSGVIMIKTKKSLNSTQLDSLNKAPKVTEEEVKKNLDNALIYIDDVESTKVQLDALNPADISTMFVIKGEDAMKKFGDKGKNGVLFVTLKKK